MIIYIGADHRGFEMKGVVGEWLAGRGMEYVDMGAESYDPDDDYNDVAVGVAGKVAREEGARGVLVCGSGHGECMQANRFAGVRAINGLTPELAEVGRRHNDANVLCIAADFGVEVEGVLRAFFDTEFDGGEKYVRRNKKLDMESTEWQQ